MSAGQFPGKVQDQVVVNGTDRLILDARFVLIPYAGPVRNISAFDIHPLGAAVTSAQADPQAYGIRVLRREILKSVQ